MSTRKVDLEKVWKKAKTPHAKTPPSKGRWVEEADKFHKDKKKSPVKQEKYVPSKGRELME